MHNSDSEPSQSQRSVAIHLIEVTTESTTADSGPAIELRKLFEDAGHTISGPETITDSPQAIRTALDGAIAASRTRCIVLCSEIAQGLRDGPVDVVSDCLDRRMPGFGERCRALSEGQDIAHTVLSRSCAGISGHTLIFAMQSPIRTQERAVQDLILPTLRHLVSETSTGVDGAQATTLTQPVARGWQAAVEAMGGTLVRDAWPTLPGPIADRAAVRAVFDTAGERGVLACPNRRRYAVYGFPDLVRPSSKVLLTADGGRADFILALHRFPAPVGILGPGAPDTLTRHDMPTRQACREIVGAPLPEDGFTVFAVDRGKVYLERSGAIGSWDGRQMEDEGLPNQVAASLVLRWSQR